MLVLRKGKPLKIEKMPRTVFGKFVYESNFTLKHNDICFMFSDGAIHPSLAEHLNISWGYDNAVDFICKSYKNDITAKTLTKLFLAVCDNLYQNKPVDDTSVIACRVRKNLPATIWIGPPVYPENDAVTSIS